MSMGKCDPVCSEQNTGLGDKSQASRLCGLGNSQLLSGDGFPPTGMLGQYND